MRINFQTCILRTVMSVVLGILILGWYGASAETGIITITVRVRGCGNGIVETGEQCDGADLNGQSCASRGYASGSLSCNANCAFNVSNCSAGGGGGGGGGWVAPTTQVVLQGMAYPGAQITILKDGQVATSIIADSQADFKTILTTLTPGIYTFGIWAEDKEGIRSIIFSFTVTVSSGMTTTITGIFIPPTIALDKTGLKKGDVLNISGRTAPESRITIRVESSSPITATVNANEKGAWTHPFNTSPLETGSHFAKAKADLNNLSSSFSKVLTFYVGKEVAPGKVKTSDINKDGRVSLTDFSILLYNWGRPRNVDADINGDSWVNLVDFSIMMYYWTG